MASATAASSLASASSSFFAGGQQLKAEKNVSRIYARFSFSGLKKKTKANTLILSAWQSTRSRRTG
uniref:Uncharacterized protein n=1 Tax=Picea sitchensis TaxID=3332 RepID=A9NY42_PICSI|nr:unknown [Picea sitchensis]